MTISPRQKRNPCKRRERSGSYPRSPLLGKRNASIQNKMQRIRTKFTNESGMELTGNLLFDETHTRTALCVDSAMMMLEDSGSAADLQLFFIISDGKIERDSRSKLRKLVRELTEKNVLLVMVIVEGDKGAKKKDSIVTMKEVSFQNGKPLVKNFIDDYPFLDYLVLEDVNSLSKVLGDALRQWFER